MSWFANWFDSPHYHTLYKNRDEKEAQVFIDNLIDYLQIPKGSKLIDIACGKGRHAKYFNKKGMDVVGVDLSQNSINNQVHHLSTQPDTLHSRPHTRTCNPAPPAHWRSISKDTHKHTGITHTQPVIKTQHYLADLIFIWGGSRLSVPQAGV